MTKFWFTVFGLLLLSLLTIAMALTVGAANISSGQIFACLLNQCESNTTQVIVWQIRLPRVLVGFVAGAGLSCAGAILQNTTRNPLADPYLFGIISGASLGAIIATITFADQLNISLPLAAFLGALFSITLVFIFSTLLRRNEQLLLVGVAVSFMLSAISQYLLFRGDPMATNRVLFWLMGSLAHVDMNNFYLISAVVIASLFITLIFHRHIDALALGDETAMTLGVNVNLLRLGMLALCAAITATIVAYCGGIAFIGLMIPHIVRHLLGSSTLKVMIGTIFIGGCFLVGVDMVARSAINNVELPIGIITSLIGSGFFLIILARGHYNNG